MYRVLIVDDYAVTQRVLGHILQRYGYITYTAINGVEALEVLQEIEVDLLILDIAMPEMDGLTLLKTLRTDSHYDDLPIIMLTASGQDEDRVTAEEIGANAFLTKPAGSAELMDVVERVLN
jgi:CheY-like chemotaxis protein